MNHHDESKQTANEDLVSDASLKDSKLQAEITPGQVADSRTNIESFNNVLKIKRQRPRTALKQVRKESLTCNKPANKERRRYVKRMKAYLGNINKSSLKEYQQDVELRRLLKMLKIDKLKTRKLRSKGLKIKVS